MTQAKLLVIVTNNDLRRRLLRTWRSSTVDQRALLSDEPSRAGLGDEPVAFSRVDVREGLSLCMFIVDGGWRREYVCRALASHAMGYCLMLGPDDGELELAGDLLGLLGSAGGPEGVIAVEEGMDKERTRAILQLPEDTRLREVDCDSEISITGLLCDLLERLAKVAAA